MSGTYTRSALGGVIERRISEADALEEWAAARELGDRYWRGDLTRGLVLWAKAGDGTPIAPVVIWRPETDAPPPPWHVDFFAQFVA
jgi:hypothetical protein